MVRWHSLLVFGSLLAAPVFSEVERPVDPRSRRIDSIWAERRNMVEANLTMGISLGDLLEHEKKLAKDMGLFLVSSDGKQREDVRLSMSHVNFGLSYWRKLGLGLDFGPAYRFHHETIGSQKGNDDEEILSSHEVLAQVRWWMYRDYTFEIGPQFGMGYSFGSLFRFPLEQDVAYSNPSMNKFEQDASDQALGTFHRSVSANGLFEDIGLGAEIRGTTAFRIGGSILTTHRSLKLPSKDPARSLHYTDYYSELSTWDVGFRLNLSMVF